MPIPPHHLAKLRCLKSGSALEPAAADLLARLNSAIESQQLRDELGRVVSGLISEALVNQDHSVLYPIVNGAVQMVREELIPLGQLDTRSTESHERVSNE